MPQDHDTSASGAEMSRDSPPQYLVAHVEQALASDGRTNTLDVSAKVVGDRVFVTGYVPTGTCREAVTDVVTEVLPDHRVVNETTVRRLAEPGDAEVLA